MSDSVYIAAVARTPMGSFNGSLAPFSAIQLGTVAVKGALQRANIQPDQVDEIILGNVLSAGLGQNPARQVAIASGLPQSTIATTVNKVCASSMKAVMLAAQTIQTGNADIIIAAGSESMTNVPYYLPKMRFGAKYGNGEVLDGIQKDGLTDVYNNYVMGVAADETADEHQISREAQDDFAISSYKRAQAATEAGRFKDEIVPVTIPGARGKPDTVVSIDEGAGNLNEAKLRSMRPAFKPNGGTVTAPNSSPLSDGACALVLISGKKARELNIPVLALIRGFADAEQDPARFTTAPALAIPKAIKRAGLTAEQVEFYELNEAFSVVACANMKILGLSPDNVNVNGGAVALGHPLGCSGGRVIVTLVNVLSQNNAKIGVAGICNGGGGASAVVIERVAEDHARLTTLRELRFGYKIMDWLRGYDLPLMPNLQVLELFNCKLTKTRIRKLVQAKCPAIEAFGLNSVELLSDSTIVPTRSRVEQYSKIELLPLLATKDSSAQRQRQQRRPVNSILEVAKLGLDEEKYLPKE
ncbi:erg10, acetyl-CoA C-acetyltransferase [Entomortierella beljakovae]|nr:erg10, acetyl-CoA C-acetyltransferase [Entomortierella beljakovae]